MRFSILIMVKAWAYWSLITYVCWVFHVRPLLSTLDESLCACMCVFCACASVRSSAKKFTVFQYISVCVGRLGIGKGIRKFIFRRKCKFKSKIKVVCGGGGRIPSVAKSFWNRKRKSYIYAPPPPLTPPDPPPPNNEGPLNLFICLRL